MSNLFGFAIWATTLAAWFNHLITCFKEDLWGFLLAGAIIPPIGVIHGIYLWFR